MRTIFSNFNRGLQKLGFLLVVFSLSVPLKASTAPGKVNFSGQWTMNDSKSDIGGGGFGIAKSLKITQEGNNLTIDRTTTNRDGEERTMTGKYTLDGKECDNSMGNRTSKSVLTWSTDGKTLTITTNSKFDRNGQSFESKSVEVWTMGADGKTLNIDLNVSSQRGERHSTLVYDKK